MDEDRSGDPVHDDPQFVQPVGDAEPATLAQLEADDPDEDGKISIVENERARLGIVDARLEELAERDGVGGAVAEAAHKVAHRLDND